jgi:pimeloyl-ACP methyl ester carboxylesterase
VSVKTVQANGLRFGYLEWGDTTKPLVLMAHGFPDSPHAWTELGSAVAAAGYWVVAPFLRGYSPSEAGPRDTTSEDLANDGAAWVGAFGREKAHLVGHDWGAELAYGAVGVAPEKFWSLTAVAIPHRVRLAFTWKMAWGLRHFGSLSLPWAEARFAKDDFAELEMLTRRWSPTWTFTKEDLAPVKACFRAPGTVHAALGYYRAAALRSPAFLKPKVKVPTLIIAGLDDPAVAVRDYESTRGHFEAGFEVLPVRGGHFCHRESPQPVIAGLIKHLQNFTPK